MISVEPRRIAISFGLALLCTAAPVHAAVSAADGKLLTELVTAAASSVKGVDVLSQNDVRNALAVEGEKAELGACEQTTQACVAEIAGALDARVVLYGDVGSLGELTILTLNLYDAGTAQSVGRTVLREASVTVLGQRVDDAVKELMHVWLSAPNVGSKPQRVLVLDLKVAGLTAQAEDPGAAKGVDWLLWGGISAATIGTAGVLVGAIIDIDITGRIDLALNKRTVTQVEAAKLIEDRAREGQLALAGYILGGAAVAVGAGLVVWSQLE